MFSLQNEKSIDVAIQLFIINVLLTILLSV